jgi:hypothetical protein
MPDVEVDPSQASGLAVWLYNRRYTFQFATRYVSENAAAIPATFEEYRDDFMVDDATLDAFVEFLNWPSLRPALDEAEVPLDEESLAAARDDLRMYLSAHIASNVWGLEAGRIVLLGHDGQVQSALGLLPQAADLLGLGPVDTAGL